MNNKNCNQNNDAKDYGVKKQQLFPGGPQGPGRPPGPPGGQPGRPPVGPPGGQPGRPPVGPPGGQPGRPPVGPPGGQPGRPPVGPPVGPPGGPPRGETPPRTAPPNFIPEAPDMQRGQFSGPSQFGPEFRGDFQFGAGNLRRCINRFTFIWLINGNSFWFYPTFVSRQFVQGFRWRRNRWEFERINLRRIFFSRCF